ncbi:putative aamy_C [Lyophyllum shimeji]|uniref:Aamy_C n=1 Tax=Lyophyllum shimeji TaxID=47721 RepID=A0A9P3UUQ8_LYOSH|nr:putative aamy_C [Lyophyllum shimeji]
MTLATQPSTDRCRAQEIIYGNGEQDALAGNYSALGDITELRATSAIKDHFLGQGLRLPYIYDAAPSKVMQISNLVTPHLMAMGESWGYHPSHTASVLMANQDTASATLKGQDSSLNSNSPDNAYVLSALFILAFNYGLPTDASGYTNPVTCFSNGWRVNAVGCRLVFCGSAQHIAFGRGNIGFIVINHDSSTWTSTFSASLPDGNYCDIIHANLDKLWCCCIHCLGRKVHCFRWDS